MQSGSTSITDRADMVSVPLNCEKIKQLREKRGLSMEEAAAAAGMKSRQRWYHVESGLRTNITLETLERMARALGVDARDLLTKAK